MIYHSKSNISDKEFKSMKKLGWIYYPNWLLRIFRAKIQVSHDALTNQYVNVQKTFSGGRGYESKHENLLFLTQKGKRKIKEYEATKKL